MKCQINLGNSRRWNQMYSHEERVRSERIIVHLNPTNIPNDLEDDTANHADQEPPCAIFDPEEDLNQQQEAEDA